MRSNSRWVNRLTPHEAQNLIEEYQAFYAWGPPYPDTPNKLVLQRRDDEVLDRLRGIAYG